MLTGYAASHQHRLNILIHMFGIPMIMFGIMIPLTWVRLEPGGASFNAAHGLVIILFLFYVTLDLIFAVVFLVLALLMAQLATHAGGYPTVVSGTLAGLAFFGGYAAQFIGHAIEKSMPVLVKHPIQANLAAPFFQIVEMFKMLGLRDELFDEVQRQVEQRRTDRRAGS